MADLIGALGAHINDAHAGRLVMDTSKMQSRMIALKASFENDGDSLVIETCDTSEATCMPDYGEN